MKKGRRKASFLSFTDYPGILKNQIVYIQMVLLFHCSILLCKFVPCQYMHQREKTCTNGGGRKKIEGASGKLQSLFLARKRQRVKNDPAEAGQRAAAARSQQHVCI